MMTMKTYLEQKKRKLKKLKEKKRQENNQKQILMLEEVEVDLENLKKRKELLR